MLADWLMVSQQDFCQAVKKRKHGQRLMNISELHEMTGDVIDLGNHPAHKYLFHDFLVVRQGVFQWDESSKSHRKVSDHYDGISEPVRLS